MEINRRKFFQSLTQGTIAASVVSSQSALGQSTIETPVESEFNTVLFTNPCAATPSDNHINLVQHLIRNTPMNPDAGSIYACISHLSDDTIVEDLLNASKNGVMVKVILRRDDDKHKDLKERLKPHVNLTYKYGCLGNKIHTKLFLFSQSKLSNKVVKNVIVAGSGNMTSGSANQHNYLFAISDAALYRDLRNYFNTMADLAHSSKMVFRTSAEFYSSSELIKTYMYPSFDNHIVNIINNIVTDGPVTPTLKIAMARWSDDDAGRNIAYAIAAKVARGCDTELVLRVRGGGGNDDVVARGIINYLAAFRQNGNKLKIYTGAIENSRTDVHSKYMLISGRYASGSAIEHNVWGGSYNFTKQALKSNDEIWFKFRDQNVFDQFASNFETLKSCCQLLPTTSHSVDS